ncbi:MAG TPA: hypothetical protein VN844_23670 [Pyrinomonadaceae bacterium]|nr:hypothetical protein [Pyrinomonadaceae bacterium]
MSLQLVVVLLLVACSDDPPDWKKVLTASDTTPTPSPAPSVETTNELVIYLDTSASMAGYVTKDGQSVFGKTLRELRFATGTFANSDAKVLVRRIASDIGPVLADMELTSASQDQNIYRGGETNLAGAIQSFRVATTPSSNAPAQPTTTKVSVSDNPKPNPIPRFHILVTDGVQSTRQGSATRDCATGSDQFCVRQKIGELLQAKWGGCILGIRADFHGKVYSEVNRAAIPYETHTNDPASFRPFYLYVFSPDPQALDSLVSSLKQRLRGLVPKSEPIRELNLSFPYTTGPAEFEASIGKDARSFISKERSSGGSSARLTLRVDVDTEKSGAKPFTIVAKLPWSDHATDTANEAELAQLLTWKVEGFYPQQADSAGKRFPDVKILQTHVDSPGQITIDATAGFASGTGDPSWRVYRIEARLNLNQISPSWIREWSVDLDTTREVGNRTFNLETALLGLWSASSAKDHVVAQGYLRIGPK